MKNEKNIREYLPTEVLMFKTEINIDRKQTNIN